MKEKYIFEGKISSVSYRDNELFSFDRNNYQFASYRIYQKEQAGIYFQKGLISDEEGFARARENLVIRPRPYPFTLESGKRSRDKTERILTDKEIMELSKDCMQYVCDKYPQFTFASDFGQHRTYTRWTNDNGMDYSNTDCAITANLFFKHKECKDISDGSCGLGMRNFNREKFMQMADNYLENYEKELELSEDIIIDMQYYSLLGMLCESLDGENLTLGTSLLADRVGEKVFSEEFTLLHDVSDEECWFNQFWDGDGCVLENDKLVLIDKGRIVTGFADKKTAKKYNIPHTRTAHYDYADLPGSGGLNLRIRRSNKTIKELLKGRLCVIPVEWGGGGFADNGDYTMPIQCAMLSDGEKILGKLPPFTMVSNLFDMFGKDFIGVGADNPIYNDKQMLFRVRKSEIE